MLSFALTYALAAAQPSSFDAYVKQQALVCVGPFDRTAVPTERDIAGKSYQISGSRMTIQTRDEDDEVRFGVVSAIKDFGDDTRGNLQAFLAWFKQEQVEWIVANGDIAADEEDLEGLLDMLGQTRIGVLVQIGNYESRGSYYRAVTAAAKKYPNIVDQNLIRIIEADDVTMVSMPGYFDRRFLHSGSGCLYKPEDIDATIAAAKSLPGNKLLISHGPPRGKGPHSIDVISDGKMNVGDVQLTRLVQAGGFGFGIFGHIIEASGRGVGGDLATTAAQDAWHNKLYINAGSANALPFGLLDGSTATGSAAIYVMKGGKAKFKHRILRKPIAAEDVATTATNIE